MSKVVIRLFQERYRSPSCDNLFKTDVVGTFEHEFDAQFYIEQAIKQQHRSWTDIINEHYIMLDTYPLPEED